jgi:hypothetical protein
MRRRRRRPEEATEKVFVAEELRHALASVDVSTPGCARGCRASMRSFRPAALGGAAEASAMSSMSSGYPSAGDFSPKATGHSGRTATPGFDRRHPLDLDSPRFPGKAGGLNAIGRTVARRSPASSVISWRYRRWRRDSDDHSDGTRLLQNAVHPGLNREFGGSRTARRGPPPEGAVGVESHARNRPSVQLQVMRCSTS